MAARSRRTEAGGMPPGARPLRALLPVAVLLLVHAVALGQEGAKNPTQPFPVIRTGGHSGLVHALVFAGPTELLSGGLDKVVHHWDASRPGELRLRRTDRLPAWKGPRGSVYAMALSGPKQGPRILAVAGYMASAQGGEIHLFRYPADGNDRPPAYSGMIGMNGLDANARRVERGSPLQGHDGVVSALVFQPGTNRLISAGEDGVIRFWDLSNLDDRKLDASASLVGAGQRDPDRHVLNTLALTPDGSQLLSAGVDATVRLWDAAAGRLLRELKVHEPDEPDDVAGSGDNINSLHVSPDGRWVAAGREDGALYLIDREEFRTLRRVPGLPPGNTAAVDAVRFHPDPKAQLLAVAVVENGLGPGGRARRPSLRSWVELRSVPDGALVHRTPALDNVIRACEFSPDGRRLAYSGGDDRAIRVLPLDASGRPEPGTPEAIGVGRGRSIWNVAFAKGENGSLRLAYSRTRSDDPDALPAAFDLYEPLRDRLGTISRDELALETPEPRYQVVGDADRPDLLRLRFEGADRASIPLDPGNDKRWWAGLVLPPKDPAEWPLVAVAMENGVGIFQIGPGPADAPTYRMIRKLVGHSGSVYALALSPDRKWLLTGGADQTVRLYSAWGLDRPAPFGATFKPDSQGGPLAVDQVTPFGMADLAGLQPGDRVREIQVSRRRLTLPDELPLLDSEPAEHPITLSLLRRDPAAGRDVEVQASTRKLQNPMVSLLALPPTPADRRGAGTFAADYVLWMPSGPYLTSIRGDANFLGWHQNQPDLARFTYLDPPVQFRPASDFEGRYLKKAEIDRVLRAGGDLTQAGPAVVPQPPRELVRRPELVPPRPQDWRLDGKPEVTLSFSRPKGDRRRLVYRVTPRLADGPTMPVTLEFPAGGQDDALVPLGPIPVSPERLGRMVRVEVAAVEPESQPLPSFDVLAPEPPRPVPPPEPRVQVVVVGASGPGEAFRIEGIGRGPKTWEGATHAHLGPVGDPSADRPGLRRFRLEPADVHRFLAGPAGASEPVVRLADHLQGLLNRARKGDDPGVPDMLVVYLEAPVLETDDPARESRILLGKASRRPLTNDAAATDEFSIPARSIIEPLATLSDDYRCRVVLFLDGVHKGSPPHEGGLWWPGVKHLTRALSRANVTVVNASESLPSRRLADTREGAMAAAWRDALDPDRIADGRIRLIPESSTLADYSRALQAAFEPLGRGDADREAAEPVSWTVGNRTTIDALLFAPEIPARPGRMANAPRIGTQKAN